MVRRLLALGAVCLLLIGTALAREAVAQPPAMPSGSAAQEGAPPDAAGADDPGAQEVSQGDAAVVIDADASVTSVVYASENADENAARVTGNVTALMHNIVVEKSGGTDSAENCNFYGQNAGLLATDGASATLWGAQVHTSGSGANGVFSYGEGTVITIADSTISTEMDNSGGILVTGGGTLIANDLTVDTQGASSAAIRSDRGGGTMTIHGGAYTSGGTGSPAIYSTAGITVSNATLKATASEAVVVEGKNSVTLLDCDVTGDMQGTYGQHSDENIHGVMIYQSMSGDADVGRASFSMTGGSLTTLAGDLFYVTNTACDIQLSRVALTLADGTLLTVAGNSSSRGWGEQGENGGDCTLTTDGQTMSGVITVDSISALTLTMRNGTGFTGTINPDGQAGDVTVTLDDTSAWTLTADAYITRLNGSADQVIANGYVLHVSE